MAAGSVIKEPIKGTMARPIQVRTKLVGKGTRDAITLTSCVTANKTGREAAMTITTNTNKGSVYCRDSAYASAAGPLWRTAMAPTKIKAQKPKTTSTSLSK